MIVVHRAFADEDPFFLQLRILREAVFWILDDDPPILGEHTPPRKSAPKPQRATDLPRSAGGTSEVGDEPVGGDAAAGDPPDDLEDAFMEPLLSGHGVEKRFPWEAVCAPMARISTGTGDDGTTGLVGGQRVGKTDARIEACGAVDETNDALGLAAAFTTRTDLVELIRTIQSDLFTLGADLAAPPGIETTRVTKEMIERLVVLEDGLEAALPALRHFILPGGTPTAAYLQLARSMARRAEREAWRVAAREPIAREPLIYLNRLSDLLFLLAREDNVLAGRPEPQWVGHG